MDPLTQLTLVGTEADQAVQAADAAALAAGVTVREATELVELEDVVRLFATIWGRDPNPPVTVELLRAFTKAGNYVGGRVRRRPAGRRLCRLLPRSGRGCPAQPHRRGRTPAWTGGTSGSPSSCTSVPGRCAVASRRSPGRSTRWSAATRTSTSSSWARNLTSTSGTSTAPCSTASTAPTTPTGCSCGGGSARPTWWRRAAASYTPALASRRARCRCHGRAACLWRGRAGAGRSRRRDRAGRRTS